MKHKTLVNELYMNPSRIESKFRSLFKEFSIGHGRIDIIGKDTNGNLCLVEVKMKDTEILSAKNQIRRYQSQLLHFLGIIGIELTLRAIVITPSQVIDLGARKSNALFVPQKTPVGIPTSREIFGLRRYEESEKLTQIAL